MRRAAVPLGLVCCGGWLVLVVVALTYVGPARWWLIVQRSAANGHYRVALAAAVLPLVPLLLAMTLRWTMRRGGWLPYCLAVAVACVVPAMLLPRLAHLVPPLAWVGLLIVGLAALLSAYAVTARAIAAPGSDGAGHGRVEPRDGPGALR